MNLFDWIARLFRGVSAEPLPTRPAIAPPVRPPLQIDYEDPRIPSGAKTRIRRILACLQDVEAEMVREQVPGFSRIDMIHMREQHLPKLIKSYIDIPAAHRSEIFRRSGKSASFILNESLDKMQAHIDEILKNLAQSDIDAFTSNIQFIAQRYEEHSDPFR